MASTSKEPINEKSLENSPQPKLSNKQQLESASKEDLVKYIKAYGVRTQKQKNEIDELKKAVIELQEENTNVKQQLEDECISHKKKFEEFENVIECMKLKEETMKSTFDLINVEIDELRIKNKDHINEIKVLSEARDQALESCKIITGNLTENINLLKMENEKLQISNNTNMENMKLSLENEIFKIKESMGEEIKTIKEEKHKLNESLLQLENKCQDLLLKISNLEAINLKNENLFAENENSKTFLEKKLENISNERASIYKELNRVRNQLFQWEKMLELERNDKDRAYEELLDFEKREDESFHQLNDLNCALQEALTERDNLRERLAKNPVDCTESENMNDLHTTILLLKNDIEKSRNQVLQKANELELREQGYLKLKNELELSERKNDEMVDIVRCVKNQQYSLIQENENLRRQLDSTQIELSENEKVKNNLQVKLNSQQLKIENLTKDNFQFIDFMKTFISRLESNNQKQTEISETLQILESKCNLLFKYPEFKKTLMNSDISITEYNNIENQYSPITVVNSLMQDNNIENVGIDFSKHDLNSKMHWLQQEINDYKAAENLELAKYNSWLIEKEVDDNIFSVNYLKSKLNLLSVEKVKLSDICKLIEEQYREINNLTERDDDIKLLTLNEENSKLKSELSIILTEKNKYEDELNKISPLILEIHKKEQSIEDLNKELLINKSCMEQLKNEIDQLYNYKVENNILLEKNNIVSEDLKSSEKNIMLLKEKIDYLESSISRKNDLPHELVSLINDNSELKTSNEHLKTEIAELRNKIENESKSIKEKDDRLNKLKTIALKSKKDFNEIKNKYDSLELEYNNCQVISKQIISERDNRISELSLEKDNLEKLMENLRKDISQPSMMDLEFADYERTIENLNKVIENKNKEIEDNVLSNTRKDILIDTLRKELKASADQIISVEDRVEKLKEMYEKTKKELSESRQIERDSCQEKVKLKLKIEHLVEENEQKKLELVDAISDKRKSEEKSKNHIEQLTKNIHNFETRIRNLTDDLELNRQELDTTQSEYESYKIKVKSVLKKQVKSDNSQDQSKITELKEEIFNLEKNNELLKNKIKELKQEVSTVQLDCEQHDDENRRLNTRIQKLQRDIKSKESDFRERLEELRLSQNSSSNEHTETIKQLTMQSQSLSKTFQEQMQNLQDEHGKSLKILQNQLEKCHFENNQLQNDISRLRSLLLQAESANKQEYVTDVIHDPSQIERPRAEGMDIMEMERREKNKIMSFEQLIATPQSPDRDFRYQSSFEDFEDDGTQEVKFTKANKKIEHLTELLGESEETSARLTEQARLLKEEIRRLERNQERESSLSNMEYLKNIVFKFLTLNSGDERLQLIPVLYTMLKLSSEERDYLHKIASGVENDPIKIGQTGAQNVSWGSYLHRWTGLN